MATIKSLVFAVVVFAALFAFTMAQERVKKQVLLGAAPYPYAAYPYGWGARSVYPHVLPLGADDGSYFPGKYDPYY